MSLVVWHDIADNSYFISDDHWQTLDNALNNSMSPLYKYRHNAEHNLNEIISNRIHEFKLK